MIDDERVGLEDVDAGPVADFVGEFPFVVDGHNHGDAVGFAHCLIVFTETWRHMYDTGAVAGLNELSAEYTERIRMIREIGEQGCVGAADEFCA